MSLTMTLVLFAITSVLVFAWLRSLLHPVTRKNPVLVPYRKDIDRTPKWEKKISANQNLR